MCFLWFKHWLFCITQINYNYPRPCSTSLLSFTTTKQSTSHHFTFSPTYLYQKGEQALPGTLQNHCHWVNSPAEGGSGLRCAGRTAPYGRKALGITRLGGKSLGVVAAAGCSPRLWSPKGRLWTLVPEPPLGLVRFSGASGSAGGAGGDEDDAAGGWNGGGDDLSVDPVALVGMCPDTQLWWGISCKEQSSSWIL